jgi:cyclic pyranopterin phosphate synthase
MPADLYGDDYQYIHSRNRLDNAEIERLARLFSQLGVSKVRITGGEPLLRKDVVELVAALSNIEEIQDLALTTNGALLERFVEPLKQAGLDRLNISIDSLDPAIFADLSGGRGNIDTVLRGVQRAADAGFEGIKINAVVQRGVNEHTVLDLLDYFRGSSIVVRFIEYMDVGNRNGWQAEDVVTAAELIETIGNRWPLRALDGKYFGEVARRYGYLDGQGEIGFVTSISQPFCGSCTRARLSSEGVLYTCLFAASGLDLRGPMRAGASDEELKGLIAGCWQQREDRYSEVRGGKDQIKAKVEMYRVGG